MRSPSKEYRYHSVTGEEMPSTLIESPVHLPAIFLSSAWTWAPESASGASLAPGSLLWARSGTLRSLPPQPQTGTVTIAATMSPTYHRKLLRPQELCRRVVIMPRSGSLHRGAEPSALPLGGGLPARRRRGSPRRMGG